MKVHTSTYLHKMKTLQLGFLQYRNKTSFNLFRHLRIKEEDLFLPQTMVRH